LFREGGGFSKSPRRRIRSPLLDLSWARKISKFVSASSSFGFSQDRLTKSPRATAPQRTRRAPPRRARRSRPTIRNLHAVFFARV
jgi:hypothetical protein